jgi:hypothetical protein
MRLNRKTWLPMRTLRPCVLRTNGLDPDLPRKAEKL